MKNGMCTDDGKRSGMGYIPAILAEREQGTGRRLAWAKSTTPYVKK
jgi:hypothetical protein